ncbi:hypothetical protein BSX46_001427 [Escherichia coli]|uniref:hypothetical protein n=1 Tax=Escherichia coli TaxID=562 RepID=UPI000BE1B127|nr:hypothetical protein [Escherichia coli]EFF8667389.1 hypothetical protein [Escherichia coli]EFJ0451355.1 hypothetical protein [Escherichia coli]EFM3349624.1 hypothetical protein [Escherichia coli]EIX4807796.1 hypothetical protein [Escherichia coli]EKM0456477.1 hypothetical protein [Escherichia coli]
MLDVNKKQYELAEVRQTILHLERANDLHNQQIATNKSLIRQLQEKEKALAGELGYQTNEGFDLAIPF